MELKSKWEEKAGNFYKKKKIYEKQKEKQKTFLFLHDEKIINSRLLQLIKKNENDNK